MAKGQVRIIVPGRFTPERKRQISRGTWTRRVDTAEAADFKAKVALFARQAAASEPFNEPLRVIYIFRSIKPASYRKHEGWPWKRPDLTNLEKIAEDAMHGIIFRDDAAVCEKASRKEFGPHEELEIVVEPLEEDWPY